MVAEHPFVTEVPTNVLADYYYDRNDMATGDAVQKMERLGSLAGGTAVAKNLRIMLKLHFPGVKFSVKSSYNSIHVKWTNGPTGKMVSEIGKKFQDCSSSHCGDYMEYTPDEWTKIFGGCKFVFCNRETTEEADEMAWKNLYPNGFNILGTTYTSHAQAARSHCNNAGSWAHRAISGTAFNLDGTIDHEHSTDD